MPRGVRAVHIASRHRNVELRTFRRSPLVALAEALYRVLVRDPGLHSLSPAGSLLIAHPGLLDPNFRRSVLFVSNSDPQEGSFGLILNRPAERIVADLLPERDDLGPL